MYVNFKKIWIIFYLRLEFFITGPEPFMETLIFLIMHGYIFFWIYEKDYEDQKAGIGKPWSFYNPSYPLLYTKLGHLDR